MNYLSVCSGIEAATVAWHHMGWKPVGFSEIEKFPSNLLAHYYPHVTNYGDMTKFKEWNINEPVNLLVGGTPCQSFSIAGLRKGLEDHRGNLMLTYLAMADHFKPKWLLWENVPGVLSSNRGSDFAALLQGMAQLGYGFAYRVLDAQHFGVPQRRRRVFVVGCLGDWRSAAKVLFERESLCWDITPRREERKTFTSRTEGCFDRQRSDEYGTTDIASTISARDYKSATDLVTVYETHPADSRVKPMGDVCQTVTTRWGTGGGNVPIATHAFKVRGGCEGGGKGYLGSEQTAFTLSTNQDQQLYHKSAVRRLTPLECERLQGFPDNYTNVPTSSDSTRYKALGNSMAVPVMRWIGQRINEVQNAP